MRTPESKELLPGSLKGGIVSTLSLANAPFRKYLSNGSVEAMRSGTGFGQSLKQEWLHLDPTRSDSLQRIIAAGYGVNHTAHTCAILEAWTGSGLPGVMRT